VDTEQNLAVTTEFANRTGYEFSDADLLFGALTHPSYTGSKAEDYQRLEFLGDRVLGVVVAEDLYRRFPEAREGDLARQFNYLVRKQTCAAAAKTIDLGSMIRSQATATGASVMSTRILGDACEAIIAAVYLDGGFAAASQFVHNLWQPFLAKAETATRDAKSLLQEWSLGLGLGVPSYKVVSRSGPDHAPLFKIRVRLPDHEPVFGEATSKRNAEQEAAQAFIEANSIETE
jgi:ribonuclease-3